MEKINSSNNIEKVLLGVIALLLLILIILQFQDPKPSEACVSAREDAIAVGGLSTYFLDTYEEDVYGSQVDNINQQIFRINEYQFLATQRLLLYQQALLRVTAECQW